MRVHGSRRVVGAAVGLSMCAAALAVPTPPAGWSSQFADRGISQGQFLDGAACLLPFETVDGPRLFVGGEFNAINVPGSATPAPYMGIAVWDGARWSGIQGGGVSTQWGEGSVAAITTMPIAGVSRVVLAGQFAAPGTGVGIGYLDDARGLHPMAAGPVPSAWFGGAFGWTPPGTGVPEVVVTSGVFPQGSEYAYRYMAAGVGSMPPGVITVTTAYAVFDDGLGGGPGLYIGVPMSGSNFADKITKWNGTTMTAVSQGQMTWVNALCVHNDGSGPALYAAGQGFRRLKNGVWEAVGGVGAPAFNINALASFDDGTGPALYAAGNFTTTTVGPSGNVTATNIARLRAGVWEALGTGLTGGLAKAMAVYDEDGPGPRPAGLYVVGKFTTAGGVSSLGIARWGVPICRADHNTVGGVNVQDIFDFLGDWFAGATRADFDGANGLTVQDIFAFLGAWFAGC